MTIDICKCCGADTDSDKAHADKALGSVCPDCAGDLRNATSALHQQGIRHPFFGNCPDNTPNHLNP